MTAAAEDAASGAPAAPATFWLIPLGDAKAVVCDGDSCVIPAAD